MILSPEAIAAMRERAEAATEAPWFPHDYTSIEGAVTVSCDHPAEISVAVMCRAFTGKVAEQIANADFIAHARSDIPALLDDRAALEEQLERYDAAAIASQQLFNAVQASYARLQAVAVAVIEMDDVDPPSQLADALAALQPGDLP